MRRLTSLACSSACWAGSAAAPAPKPKKNPKSLKVANAIAQVRAIATVKVDVDKAVAVVPTTVAKHAMAPPKTRVIRKIVATIAHRETKSVNHKVVRMLRTSSQAMTTTNAVVTAAAVVATVAKMVLKTRLNKQTAHKPKRAK